MDDGEAISLIEMELGHPIEEIFLLLKKTYRFCLDRTSLFRCIKNWRKSSYKNSTSQYQTQDRDRSYINESIGKTSCKNLSRAYKF